MDPTDSPVCFTVVLASDDTVEQQHELWLERMLDVSKVRLQIVPLSVLDLQFNCLLFAKELISI